jgi:hypothetical protein
VDAVEVVGRQLGGMIMTKMTMGRMTMIAALLGVEELSGGERRVLELGELPQEEGGEAEGVARLTLVLRLPGDLRPSMVSFVPPLYDPHFQSLFFSQLRKFRD